jgi:hypothetical protein
VKWGEKGWWWGGLVGGRGQRGSYKSILQIRGNNRRGEGGWAQALEKDEQTDTGRANFECRVRSPRSSIKGRRTPAKPSPRPNRESEMFPKDRGWLVGDQDRRRPLALSHAARQDIGALLTLVLSPLLFRGHVANFNPCNASLTTYQIWEIKIIR